MTARAPTVLQVVPALSSGGVERTAVDVAAALARAGGASLVASSGGRLVAELEAAGAEWIALPAASKNPLTMAANAFRLMQIVRARTVDIVHARSRAPAWSALAAARRTGAAFVTTYAGIHTARTALKRRYNAVMAAGDFVIANSEFTAAHIRREHGIDPARLRVIPRGSDLSAFAPGAEVAARAASLRAQWGEGPILLLPGRLTRLKGQSVAIAALAQLGRPATLVLAGGPEPGREAYARELEEAARAAGVRAVFAGHVADMPAAYAACDVALSCSTSPESFGRTMVEAQALERPVVATAHGGSLETVQDGATGVLVPPGDAAALTAALRTLLDDPARRAAMGRAGRAFVTARFTVEAMCAATLAVYDEALALRRTRQVVR